jgi:hypothetical protein
MEKEEEEKLKTDLMWRIIIHGKSVQNIYDGTPCRACYILQGFKKCCWTCLRLPICVEEWIKEGSSYCPIAKRNKTCSCILVKLGKKGRSLWK